MVEPDQPPSSTELQTAALWRAATMITAAAIVSRILGYVRESFLAARFGVSGVTDAYIVAQDVPTTVNIALVGALVSAFIPLYQDAIARRGPEAGRRMTNTVVSLTLIAGILLVGLGMAGAPLIVELAAGEFAPEKKALTIALLRIALPAVLLFSLSGVATALLNANRKFGPPALVGIGQNVAIITALVLASGPADVTWVAASIVVGAALTILVQVPWLPAAGFRYRPIIDLSDPAVRRLGQLLVPVLLSFVIFQLQIAVDRRVASGLIDGSISALNFAHRLNSLPYGVIGVAVTTVLFPTLSAYAAAGSWDELRRSVRTGLHTLMFLLVPMAVGLWSFREPIVRLVFERGAFQAAGTQMTAGALQYYALGVLFMGWLDLLNRTFYAMQDTLTPLFVAAGSVSLNLVLNLLLVGPMAIGGLALATATAMGVGVGALLFRLHRRLGSLELASLFKGLLWMLAASGAGAVAGGWVMRLGLIWLGTGTLGQFVGLMLALICVALAHLVAAAALGIPEAEIIKRLVARLFK